MKYNYRDLSYEDFKRMAEDNDLTPNEKIGFYGNYRDGKENIIFSDILNKVKALNKKNIKVLDIGCGCGPLIDTFINHSINLNQSLFLIDSYEVLNQVKPNKIITKIDAEFPLCSKFINKNKFFFDVIVLYSSFQYIYQKFSIHKILKNIHFLLKPGGYCFIGDLPNQSARIRFLKSNAGVDYHNKNFSNLKLPNFDSGVKHKQINDKVILNILRTSRSQGFNSYIYEQNELMPFAKRREDILLIKPI